MIEGTLGKNICLRGSVFKARHSILYFRTPEDKTKIIMHFCTMIPDFKKKTDFCDVPNLRPFGLVLATHR
jgi:hypothetical protein